MAKEAGSQVDGGVRNEVVVTDKAQAEQGVALNKKVDPAVAAKEAVERLKKLEEEQLAAKEAAAEEGAEAEADAPAEGSIFAALPEGTEPVMVAQAATTATDAGPDSGGLSLGTWLAIGGGAVAVAAFAAGGGGGGGDGNDAPVSSNGAFTVNEDAVLSGTLPAAADEEDDPITYSLATNAQNGTVVVNPNGTFTYTPNANYNGPDSFTFTVTDDEGASNTYTANINVTSINDLPVANDGAFTTAEDTAVIGNVLGTDVETGAASLVYTVVTGPASGVLNLNPNGSFTYTPAANFNGQVTFSYAVTDANGGSDTATVTINVTPVNDAPVAANGNATTAEDTALNGTLPAATDADGNPINYTLATAPQNGTVVVNGNGTYTYTPALNFNGNDSFTFTVSDGQGGTNTYTQTISVTPVNDAPVVANATIVGLEDTVISGNLPVATDVDGDTLTYALASAPANGVVTVGTNGSFVYTPNANFNGADSFTFTVSDGNGGTVTRTATVQVQNVNDAPTSGNATVTVAEDNVLSGNLPAATDIDGNPVTFSLGAQAANGIAVVNANGSYTYTPALNFNGTDSFTFTVADGQGGSNTYTVTVTVTPVNDAPVAQAATLAATEDVVLSGNLPVATDVDGDTLTYSLVAGTLTPGSGTVSVNPNGSFVYTPAANFNGTASFTYQVSDGNGGTATAVITLNVASVNDAPVAGAAEVYSTLQGQALVVAVGTGVLANDTDVETPNANLIAVLLSDTSNGALTLNANGSFTYTPLPNFFGDDTFTYQVSDGQGGLSAPVTVTINVQQLNFVFTPATDSFTGTAQNENFVGTNNNLNTNDSVVGGGGNDTVFHSVDTGSNNTYAGFIFQDVDTFVITADSAAANDTTTYDLSSSNAIGTLRISNSSDSVVLTSAGAGARAPNTTFLEILAQTNPLANISLDIRDVDAVGAADVVDVVISAAANFVNSVNALNIDGAIETTRIHTQGPLAVIIDDLNTNLGGIPGGAATIQTLVLDAQSASLTINQPLTGNVRNVVGDSSTQNLSFSAFDAIGSTTITTGSGNDTVIGGNSVANTITTNAGADSVTGGTANDVITTGDGADSVSGLAGADVITTGNGTDTVSGGDGNDNINTGADADQILDGEGNDVVDAGDGNDRLTLNGGSDNIFMGAGDDTVNAGAGTVNELTAADIMNGGAGNDRLVIFNDTATSDLNNVTQFETIFLTENGTPYNYVITNLSAFDNDGATLVTIDGSTLTSSLTFNGAALDSDNEIILIGGSGNDTLIAGEGTDTIVGNLGNDSLVGNGAGDRFEFDGGELNALDSVAGGAGADSIILIQNSNEFGGPEEQFVMDAGITGVENTIVEDNGNGGDVALTLNAGYAQALMTIDASALDANEDFTLHAQNNAGGENLNVIGGAGNDTLQFGAGADGATTGAGNDLIVFDNGMVGPSDLNAADRVDGGDGIDTIQTTSGTQDNDYAGVSNVEILTIDALGTSTEGEGLTTIGTNAQAGGIRTVNLNPGNEDGAPTGGASAATDTLNAGAYTAGLTVNDFAGNDSILTGSGNDAVFMGLGNDNIATGAGDDQIFTQFAELTFTDSLAGGAGVDAVRMDNTLGAVTAGVNLTNVTDIENYTFVFGGDRPGLGDVDNNTLTFTGGNVGTVTAINIDASTLTDTQDSFTVTLDANQLDADYAFVFTGSATNDTFIKQNDAIQNTVIFTGGLGNDTLEMNGDSQGANIVFDGDGLGAPSNSIANPNILTSTVGLAGDVVRSSGGTFIDNDFTNISNVEIFTSNTGVAINAVLGGFAASSGLDVVIGSTNNDNVLFNAAFGNNILVDVSNGGNDTINAGAIGATVTFLGDAADFTAADALTGGNSSTDTASIRNNGVADLTTMTLVETINILDAVFDGDVTVTIDTGLADLNGVTFQTIDGTQLDVGENFRLNAETATVSLLVNTGAGDDTVNDSNSASTINTGVGNDAISGRDGADLIDAGGGNDFIIIDLLDNIAGNGDADQITAGAGSDTVIAGTGGDNIVLTTDGVEDIVQLNPANLAGTMVVDGAPTITGFVAGVDELRINSALVLDSMQFLAQDATGVTHVFGQSWASAGFPEIVAISTVGQPPNTFLDVGTAAGVADFLRLNDLAADADPNNPPAGNAQRGVFVVTNGTHTYVWLYQDDSDNTVAADDFTLLATLLNTTGVTGADLRLTAGTFTPLDDVVVVASGSVVDGLDGNDAIFLVPNTTNGATVTASNIETVNGTIGNDTITFNDADTVPQTVEVFGNGTTGGGSELINISNGQTLVLHSSANIVVGGGAAVDDNVNGNATDTSVETVILANDGAPHIIGLTGVENVVGSTSGDLITWAVNNNGSVAGGAGNDTVNGAAGGQRLTVENVEIVNANTGNDTINVIGNNGTINGNAGTDTISGSGLGDTVGNTTGIEVMLGGAGDDQLNAAANGQSIAITGGTGDDRLTGGAFADTFTVNVGTDGADSVLGGDGQDVVQVTNANPIRLTFTSADVGNGDAFDGNNTPSSNGTLPYGGAEDGGLAVRFQSEDGVDGLTGPISRYDDEGVTFQGALFDVRDLGLGAARGTFNTVSLLTAAGDVFTATGLSDYVNSGAGNDNVSGLGGADFLVGNGGDDTLDGGAGNDTLFGGGGADDMRGGDDNDLINGIGGGNDTFNGGAGNDTGLGTTAADTITITALESLSAGDGNDTITETGDLGLVLLQADLGSGDDRAVINSDASVTMGAGNDAITNNGNAGLAVLTATGGDGSDTVQGNLAMLFSVAEVESVIGSIFTDTLSVTDATGVTAVMGDSNDSVSFTGPSGNGTVNGGAGVDQILGSAGSDNLSVTLVENISTNDGADLVVLAVANPATVNVNGGLGADSVVGSSGADLISVTAVENLDVGAGNDLVTVTDATPILVDLGFDNDSIAFTGLNANATINGNAGLDTVTATNGNDILAVQDINNLTTLGGNDNVTVLDSSPIIVDLGAGNDSIVFNTPATATVEGGLNNDTVIGSGGNDILTLTGVESAVVGNGNDTITTDGSLTMIDLGAGSDSLTYTTAANATVIGGADTDTVVGSAFNDIFSLTTVESLSSAAGNDTITADGALINANLGDGNDSLTYNAQANASVDGGAGNDSLVGSNLADSFNVAGVESISGLDGNDSVTLSVANPLLVTVNGGNGTDQILGSAGSDNLAVTLVENISTNAGADSVLLSAVNAVTVNIDGGDQADTVTGSVGADSLNLTEVESLNAGSGDDRVTTNAALANAVLGLGDDSLVYTGAIPNAFVDGEGGNDTLVGSALSDQVTVQFVEVISMNDGADTVSLQTANPALVTIDGGNGTDTVNGSLGSDNLSITSVELVATSQGNDSILLAAVNAAQVTVSGGLGNDTLTGSSGNDNLLVDSTESVSTGDGADSVVLSAANVGVLVTINGGNGNDLVTGSAGNDSLALALVEQLDAADGNDTVTADGALTSADLGAGADSLTYNAAANASVNGNGGNDTLVGSGLADSFSLTSVESVSAAGGNDSITLAAVNTLLVTIDGGAGTDQVVASVGNDMLLLSTVETLNAGDGNDTVTADGSLTSVVLGIGTDSLTYNAAANATVNGGDGTDTLVGSGGSDSFNVTSVENIALMGGGDSVTLDATNAGTVTVDGGLGVDNLTAAGGNDVLVLTGVEMLDAGAGNDTVTADGALLAPNLQDGDDSLTFTTAANAGVDGGAGNDTVVGSAMGDILQNTSVESVASMGGDDTITSGAGNTALVTIDGGAGVDRFTGGLILADNVNVTAVENISLAGGNDSLVLAAANAALVTIDGGIDNDTVIGSGGNDLLALTTVETLNAGAGNDTVTADGALANAALGDGDDRLTYTAAVTATVMGGIGNDSVNGSAGNDILTLTLVENIDAGDGNDTVSADGAPTTVVLGLGDDSITFSAQVTVSVNGTGGNDTVVSAAGNDNLTLTNVDNLDAGGGNDSISADGDLDTAVLGEGNDILTITSAASATVAGGNGIDQVLAQGPVNLSLSGVENATTSVNADNVTVTDSTAIVLNAGDGADVIRFTGTTATGTVDGGAGADGITTTGGVDVLRLTGIEAVNAEAGSDLITITDAVALNADLGGENDRIDFLALANATILGSAGNDTVNAAAGANNDVFRVQDVEQIDLQDGNDNLTVVSGAINVIGAGGDDTVAFLGSVGTIDGGAGTDHVFGAPTADLLQLTNVEGVTSNGGNDSITVTSINNTLVVHTNDGDDTVTFNPGVANNNATVDGGAGNDTVNLNGGTATLINVEGAVFTNGNDTVTVDGALQTANMLDGDDSLTYTAAANATVNGGLGMDSVTGSALGDIFVLTAVESVNAGEGNNTVSADASLTVAFGAGDDALSFAAAAAGITGTYLGGAGANTFTGSALGDSVTLGDNGGAVNTFGSVSMGDGNDTVAEAESGGAFGAINLGAGDDQLTLSSSSGSVDGGLGNDNVTSTAAAAVLSLAGVETVVTGGGADQLTFTAAANATVDGGLGNDNLTGSSGADVLILGGIETLSAGDGSDMVTENGGVLSSAIMGDGNDSLRLTNVASVTLVADGGIGDDTVQGSAGNDTLQVMGFERIDLVDGGTDSVTLTAANLALVTVTGTGDDDLTGSAGSDNLAVSGLDNISLNDGDDSVVLLAANPATVVINGGLGSDTVSGSSGNDDLIVGGVELVNAGDGNDTVNDTAGAATVNGGLGNDQLVGGDGNDVLSGEGGTDTLSGGNDADSLSGGAENDQLNGGAGTDTLDGGMGVDMLTGGTEADLFQFLVGGTGITDVTADQITDFLTTVDDVSFQGGAAGIDATNYAESQNNADFGAALIQANAAFDGAVIYYFAATNTGTAYLFHDANADGSIGAGDAVVAFTGAGTSQDFFAAADIVSG